jgi:hypothetical protein
MRLGLATCLALLALGGNAAAAEHVSISARFSPLKLGAPAAMTLGMTVTAQSGQIPSPLTGIDLRYPPNLGLATSGLGTATCRRILLEEEGPKACPRNSIMGSGEATARFRVGPEVFRESAAIAIVAGPSQNGLVTMLIGATGISPVIARIVMSSTLQPGHLQIAVPLVPSLPEGEDVSVVAVHATLGGNLTYTEHGRSYHPRGVTVPRHCPTGGFRFSGHFTFLDGTATSAQTVIPCPHRH